MTVKHLRSVQRQQLALAAAADSTVVGKYRAGFSECAQEVTRYLSQVDGLSPDTRGRLMQHLGSCVQRLHPEPAHPGVHIPTPTHAYAQPLHLQMPSATPVSTLPGTPATSPQQALLNSSMSSVNGVPVIPAFNLSQLQVVGGLVIPTNTVSLQQQQQHQQLQQHVQNQTSCQFRDMNNNDVNPMPSLMGKHQPMHAQELPPRTESRESHHSSMSSQSSPAESVSSHHSSPPLKQHPIVPEPIKLERNPTPKVVVPQPQLGSVWRPWSSSLLVH